MGKLSQEQIQELEVFAYYVRGYGYNKTNGYVTIYDECSVIDNNEVYWDDVDSYDDIDNTIIGIIEDNDLLDEFSSECFDGNLEIEIDCKEKTIVISGNERVLKGEDSRSAREVDEISKDDPSVGEEIEKLFDEMRVKNEISGYIQFNGSGDDGEIDEYLNLKGRDYIRVDDNILDFLYQWLESHLPGWEIDSGSYGYFTFNTQERNIILDLTENEYEGISLGPIFYGKF